MRPVDPRLMRQAPQGRSGVALTAVLGVVRAVLAVGQALLLAHVLAVGFAGAGLSALREPLAWLVAVVVLRALASTAQDVVSGRTAAAVKADLRRSVLQRVTELGPGWLVGRRSGELTTLLGAGVEALDGYFRLYLPQLVLSVTVPVAVLVALALTDWRSAFVVAVTLPLLPLFLALVGMHTRDQTDRQWRELSGLGGHFLDVVTGLPTLRVFGRAQAQVDVLRRITTSHREATVKALRTAFLSALVLELVATLAVAVVAVAVGFRLLHGDVGLEAALAVLLLTPEAFLPLRAVGAAYHSATDGLTAAEAAFAVLDEPAPQLSAGHRLPTLGRISLEGVTVRREGRSAALLDGVDLAMAPGDRLALVGPSGSGKSTLIGVVLGLVVPDEGRVLVDGIDAGELDLARWRQQVAWVPQSPHLFARSVADNIRLGRPEASDAEVLVAAAEAHVDEFATRLPQGYATVLGERGEGVSVGQARRIAVARAFLRDAPFVVLDEPTAGLDSRSEAVVAAAVERLSAGRTVLLATHRLDLVTSDYRVVRLDAGRVGVLA